MQLEQLREVNAALADFIADDSRQRSEIGEISHYTSLIKTPFVDDCEIVYEQRDNLKTESDVIIHNKTNNECYTTGHFMYQSFDDNSLVEKVDDFKRRLLAEIDRTIFEDIGLVTLATKATSTSLSEESALAFCKKSYVADKTLEDVKACGIADERDVDINCCNSYRNVFLDNITDVAHTVLVFREDYLARSAKLYIAECEAYEQFLKEEHPYLDKVKAMAASLEDTPERVKNVTVTLKAGNFESQHKILLSVLKYRLEAGSDPLDFLSWSAAHDISRELEKLGISPDELYVSEISFGKKVYYKAQR